MNCPLHASEPVAGICARCDRFVCELDARELEDVFFCVECAEDPRPRERTHRAWRPFAEARAFVHTLGLKNHLEWVDYSKGAISGTRRPEDIPSDPYGAYAADWLSWGDWLGTAALSSHTRTWRSFEEARDFARSLRLPTSESWVAFAKGLLPEKGTLPVDVPAAPGNVYEDKWLGFGDWLGTGRVANFDKVFRPFEEARAFARSLGLASFAEWRHYAAGRRPDLGVRPDDVPAGPYATYAQEWQGWGDWLGTGAIAWRGRAWRPFKEARAFARSLGLANKDEWTAFAKGELPGKGTLPTDVPANPVRVYKEQGWRGTSDWLGLDRRRGPYRPFEEARAFARGLGLGSVDEWRDYVAGKLLPEGMPGSPHKSYAEKWQGWKNWLGKPSVRWRPFEEARAFARGLGLRTTAEWRAFCLTGRLPHDVPGKPERVYDRKGWKGIRDWLGE